MCDGVPAPPVAIEIGVLRAYSISAFRSFEGRALFEMITCGLVTNMPTGAKSLSRSYSRRYMAPLMTCGPMWPMLTMYAAGAARTTRLTPMLPPAPVTFSTTTVWPRLFVIRSAMIRAIVSVGPPAENGTTTVTGRTGKFCADAALQQKAAANASSRGRFMAPLFRDDLRELRLLAV